jgi:hypothetical protein
MMMRGITRVRDDEDDVVDPANENRFYTSEKKREY